MPDRDASARRLWSDLRASEIPAVAARDPVLVLPLGSTEQHGPHLPLSTDLDIALGLLDEAFAHLPADAEVWVLPGQALGASREHARVPGTVSLEAGVLEALLVDTGRSLARAGVRRLVLHTGHGGNRAAMESAALRLRDEEGMLVVKVHYPRLGRPPEDEARFPEAEWRRGLHAGAVETAMMLHLRPGSVRMDAAPEPTGGPGTGRVPKGELLGPEGPASWAWLAGDLDPSGVSGDPRLATPEAGRALVRHWGEALARLLVEVAAHPVPGNGAPGDGRS